MTRTKNVMGADELIRFLEKLPEELYTKAVTQTIKSEASKVAKLARSQAPFWTGTLQRSVRVSTKLLTRVGGVSSQIKVGGKNKKGDAYYARWVEHGFRHVVGPQSGKRGSVFKKRGNRIREGRGSVWVAPRPSPQLGFLRYALDQRRALVVSSMVKKVRSIVKKNMKAQAANGNA